MDTNFRQQIDDRQALTFSSLGVRTDGDLSFLPRVSLQLRENFFGQHLSKKIRFVGHAIAWLVRTISKRIPSPISISLRLNLYHNRHLVRVAVRGKGSLGDILTQSLLLERLFEACDGSLYIDFFSHPYKEADASFVFRRVPFVRHVYSVRKLKGLQKYYDLILDVGFLPKFEITNYQRVRSLRPGLIDLVQGASQRFEPYAVYFKNLPVLDGLYARNVVVPKGMNVAEGMGYFANIKIPRDSTPVLFPDEERQNVLLGHGLLNRNYVTIHNGYDVSYRSLSGIVTKCWPKKNWQSFVEQFKSRFPSVLIVQVGAENGDRIEGVDIDLVGRTSLDEVSWILKHSLAHIDGESGLARLARALHAKSIVLFGPTSKEFFSFDRNVNIVSTVCNDCWWSALDWLSNCPRKLPEPICMVSISPKIVLDHVSSHLNGIQTSWYALESKGLFDLDGLQVKHRHVLADMFSSLDLPAVPISEHSTGSNGIYLHASKQWEYLFAWSVIEAHQKLVTSKIRIVDVGGGRGALSPYLAKKGFDVEVIDVDYLWDSDGSILPQTRFLQWAKRHGLKTKYGSMFNLPVEDCSYDVVLSISVLEHAKFKNFALKEALRALKPGGILIMTFDFALHAERNEDRLRQEIFSPFLLADVLAELGVGVEVFSLEEVRTSIAEIRAHQVRGIPDQMTVGAIALRKLLTSTNADLSRGTLSKRGTYLEENRVIGALLNGSGPSAD